MFEGLKSAFKPTVFFASLLFTFALGILALGDAFSQHAYPLKTWRMIVCIEAAVLFVLFAALLFHMYLTGRVTGTDATKKAQQEALVSIASEKPTFGTLLRISYILFFGVSFFFSLLAMIIVNFLYNECDRDPSFMDAIDKEFNESQALDYVHHIKMVFLTIVILNWIVSLSTALPVVVLGLASRRTLSNK